MKIDLTSGFAPALPAGASLFILSLLILGLSLGCSAPRASQTPLTASPGGNPGLVTASPSGQAPNLTQASAPAALAPTATPTLFRLASPSPTLSPTAAELPPSATPVCQDGLRYLSDITVPDGAIVAPGDLIDKQWQVENSGSCNWNERYSLRRISGPALGSPDQQALYPARSGTQAVIRIPLVAPSDPGTYRSAWQAYNPQGNPFGDPIYVEILVTTGSP